MAITQNDVQPGVYETIVAVSIGTFTLDTWDTFKLDGYFPFLLSGIVVKQGATTVPASNYELAQDTEATAQEVGLSGKTLYGAIRITNSAYTGIELTISGSNFGTYSSTQGTKDYIENLLLTKTAVEGSNINEGEQAIFVGGGVNIESDNTGSISQWDIGTIYNSKGTLVRREGITYSSTGKTTNQGIDPSDIANAGYWYEPDSARDLKRQANRCSIVNGDFHIVNDRLDGNYSTSFKVDKSRVGGVDKDFFMIHLDGSVVTGDTTLETLLSGNPYIDLIAPEVVGTRTLIDMGSRHITPMSSGGDNDVLGGVLEDRGQGHIHNDGTGGLFDGVAIYGVDNSDVPGFASDNYSAVTGSPTRGYKTSVPKTDGGNGTPRIGTTTRPKEFTVGSSYIIVMVAA